MARKLHISYNEYGIKIGSVKFLVDGTEVCALSNHHEQDIEISEDSHTVQAKVAFLSVFKGTIDAGENNWTLTFDQPNRRVSGKFVLYEHRKLPLMGLRSSD